ncbi:MAG: dihydrodipicolinate synthase family protein [Pirellulales bacterium]|nr:dihydrodipicolinate synthase family protein [Pirellulales bacterium]
MRFPQGNLAACVLPWKSDWELDAEVFQEHLQRTIDLGYVDLYLMGTAGEGYALSDNQFDQVVRIFAAATARPGLRPQVGVISLSMRQIIDRIAFCRELGIRIFQISLPSWGALNDNELMAFFRGVCGSFPDCQFLHYNLARSKRILSGADYRRIADCVPNLVATKNSTSDLIRISDLMKQAPDLQHFFVENAFALGTLSGECSLLCSFGLLFPNSTRQWFEAAQNKDLSAVWRFHRQFAELETILFSHVTTQHIDGAFDKALAWLTNQQFPTSLLPPYEGLSERDKVRVREAYAKHCTHLS